MKLIPFRRFEGFLKQHAHESLSPLEQELFDALFPAFQGDDEAEKSYAESKANPFLQALADFITTMPGDRRQRRFSGAGFPRSRYYSVANDRDGNDQQTLAHELRAYRRPVELGMVEVIDLAGGCRLMIGAEQVELEPRQAIAVLIHNAKLLPEQLQSMAFRMLPKFKDKPISLYCFPYNVSARTIDNVIDLRFPDVQEWFFETFRVPGKETNGAVLPDYSDPTIAYSRFHLDNGRAPIPESFWKMLPTLMNPDLGGGNPGATGSTLMWIGHWMRQHAVNALIYPSARCNVTTIFQDGDLEDYHGWNLLLYEDTKPFGPGVDLITFDHSPWAWTDFERGVRLHRAPTGELSGSFVVDGVVDYWARDYLGQIEALDAARRLHSLAGRADSHTKGARAFGFWMGILSLRWLRYAWQRRPETVVDECLLELEGLALPFDIYYVLGRTVELWNAVKEGTMNAGSAILECIGIADRAGKAIARKCPNAGLEGLLPLGNDLEFLLMTASAALSTNDQAVRRAVPAFADRYVKQLPSWFDESTATALLDFLKDTPGRVESGSWNAEQLLEEESH